MSLNDWNELKIFINLDSHKETLALLKAMEKI